MNSFVRPLVVISKCLGFAPCRYDGECLTNSFVRLLKSHVKFLPICPEMEVGLGVPRERILIVRTDKHEELRQPATGRNLTRKMNSFARRYLVSLGDVDGFILKGKSPSCGIRNTKRFESPDPQARALGRGPGLFASQALQKFGHLAIEDEERLAEHRTREHWLTKLFTLARFRAVKKSRSVQRLLRFHAANKYLLLAYNRSQTLKLDGILTDITPRSACAVLEQYEHVLRLALKRVPRRNSVAEMMAYSLSHYAPHLDAKEKRDFRRCVDLYREGRTPLSTVRKMIQVWAVRYDKEFLRAQTLFRPYPGELMHDIS